MKVWIARVALVALGIVLVLGMHHWSEARADSVPRDPEAQVVCGGAFGLRGWAQWSTGWGHHANPCHIRPRCVRGILTLTLPVHPSTTGYISTDTDETLGARYGIHAGVSLGPRVARVTFWREVLRGDRIVPQRVSCWDRAFRDRLANLWVIWIVNP